MQPNLTFFTVFFFTVRCIYVAGFLALGHDWQSYCKALEFYLQQVATHPILSKCKALDSFLTKSEVGYKHTGHGLDQGFSILVFGTHCPYFVCLPKLAPLLQVRSQAQVC